MELGKAKMLRTGLNTLHQAIHPIHGIAWTDGKQVCLTSFYFVNGEIKFGDTNVIGQFEHVFGLFWGPLCSSGSPALLAVQHKKHVTVWQLQLSALEQNKLLCTQTCEMSEPFPLLSQGCVWHPRLDVLVVLTKRDTSVLFSVRVDNRRVKADIRGSGIIHCACWTKEGTRLVVAVGSALHSYIWNDAHKSLVACSFCPIFDVGGYICAIEATREAQVAVATELPLDKICGLNAGMEFEMSTEMDSLHGQASHVVLPDDNGVPGARRRSFGSNLSSISGPIDLTHILARHRCSDPSPLLNLRRQDTVTGSGQDSSHLILVTYERKVTTTRKVNIPGILVPDIVAFDSRGSTVAVASNACSMVLVYCITASAMPNVQQISLLKNERPKGVCFLSDKMLLMMVGRQKTNDPAFLASSNTDKYILRITAKELIFNGETPVRPSSPQSPSHFHTGIRRHSVHLPEDAREHLGIKDLLLPGGATWSPGGNRRRLVEEVRSREPSPVPSSQDLSDRDSDRASSSASSVTVENFAMDHGRRITSLAVAGQAGRGLDSRRPSSPRLEAPDKLQGRDSSRPSSPRLEAPDKLQGLDSSRPSSPRLEAPDKLHNDTTLPVSDKTSGPAKDKECHLEQLTQNMERLFTRCTDVQQCLTEIRDCTQNRKKASSGYPSFSDAPYVNVTCQMQLTENVFTDERRPVLLCEGKLCLRVLQELFSLTVVEMMYGPLWIVLVADADGFVPLTLKSNDELTVRNGKRKSTLRIPANPETPFPPSPSPGPSPMLNTNTTPETTRHPVPPQASVDS